MKQEGYLIITDISGYTGFLTRAELEHAHDVLDSLFKTLLSNINPPLMVSKLEGDTIFAFSPDGSFIQGQTLLEAIENLYYAFASALETMRINTTCTCNACKLIPTLDLKFAIHYGEFMRAMVGSGEELSGPDVILVHRLLKNTVIEETGIKAYAFFTQAAVDHMDLGEITDSMIKHTENYEHIGDVPGYVHDLKPVYKTLKERRRITIQAEDAWFTISAELSAPPVLVWDYLNVPHLRAAWLQVEGVSVTDRKKGRVDIGSVQHCAHGNHRSTPFTILDWRPFEYVTQEMPTPYLGGTLQMMTRLTPTEEGSHIEITWSNPTGKSGLHTTLIRLGHAPLRGMMIGMMEKCAGVMGQMLVEDEQSGKIICELPTATLAATA